MRYQGLIQPVVFGPSFVKCHQVLLSPTCALERGVWLVAAVCCGWVTWGLAYTDRPQVVVNCPWLLSRLEGHKCTVYIVADVMWRGWQVGTFLVTCFRVATQFHACYNPQRMHSDFPEKTAFERYCMPWKHAKKPICIIALDLPRPDTLALCTLEAQEVTTKGVYWLPHAIY